MLTGSLAAVFSGQPRATRDIDIVIEIESGHLDRLVGLTAAGLYMGHEAARDAVRDAGQFKAIGAETGWKADFMIRTERDFSRSEFDCRKPVVLLGIDVWLASVEDLVLAKLEWSELGDSALQGRDIADMCRCQEP